MCKGGELKAIAWLILAFLVVTSVSGASELKESVVFKGSLYDLDIMYGGAGHRPFGRGSGRRNDMCFAARPQGGFLIACADLSKSIHVISVPGFRVEWSMDVGEYVMDMALSPDGRTLIVSTLGSRVTVYDAHTGSAVRTLWEGNHPDRPDYDMERGGYHEHVYVCQFSSEGVLALAAEEGVRVSGSGRRRVVGPMQLQREGYGSPYVPGVLMSSDLKSTTRGPECAIMVNDVGFSSDGRYAVVRKMGIRQFDEPEPYLGWDKWKASAYRMARSQWEHLSEQERTASPAFLVCRVRSGQLIPLHRIHEDRVWGRAAALTTGAKHLLLASEENKVEVWGLDPVDHYWDIKCENVLALYPLSVAEHVAIYQGEKEILFFSTDLLDVVARIDQEADAVFGDPTCRYLMLRDGFDLTIVDTESLLRDEE